MTEIIEFYGEDGSYAGKRVGEHIFDKRDKPILDVIDDELIVIETGEHVGYLAHETVLNYFNRPVASADWKPNS